MSNSLSVMLINPKYLADIDAEAKELFSRLVKELAEKESVTALKH